MSGLDEFGRDDGVRCACGGKTYRTYDQGDGLMSYTCETCGAEFTVQYDVDDASADDE